MEGFADANGIKIHYQINGNENSEPLILVSGWTLKKEMWIAQVGPLSEHFRVITFDNRGCGKSDRPDIPYTMHMFADDIIGLMDYLKIEKAHLMGYALGGMILQVFALKYPQRVNKLVLLNTVGGFPDKEGLESVRAINIKALDFQQNAPEKYFLKSAKMGYHRDFIKQLEADPNQRFHGLWTVAEFAKEYTINPQTPKDVANQCNAMLDFNVLDKLSELKCKTLIIAASHNKLHPKIAMEAMHEKIPNSRLEIIQKAGDSAYLSRAPEINELVIVFLM